MTTLPTALVEEMPLGSGDPTGVPDAKSRSMWRRGLSVFLENKLGVFGLVVLIALALFSFLGPLFYHISTDTDLYNTTAPPGAGHPLGTDQNGVDQMGQLIKGGQVSLEVGVAAGLISAIVGTIYGAVAGYLGGFVDAVMMRIIDAALSIPVIFLLIFLATLHKGGLNTTVMIWVLGGTGWFTVTRLIRGESMALKVRDYVAASKMMGAGDSRVIFRHILPNTIGITVVNSTFAVANSIFALSTLSFIGLGLQYPSSDWGAQLSNGASLLPSTKWWMIYPPGLCIILVIISFNFVGDALRDAFETRLQKR
jgi:peptide/nickel transport system permease protein